MNTNVNIVHSNLSDFVLAFCLYISLYYIGVYIKTKHVKKADRKTVLDSLVQRDCSRKPSRHLRYKFTNP